MELFLSGWNGATSCPCAGLVGRVMKGLRGEGKEKGWGGQAPDASLRRIASARESGYGSRMPAAQAANRPEDA